MLRGLYNAYKEAFYRLLRRRMRPLTIAEAEEKKLFWAKCYLCSGILMSVYTLYKLSNSKHVFDKDQGKMIRPIGGISDSDTVRVIKFSGFTKVADYQVMGKDVNSFPVAASEDGSKDS